MLKQDGHYVEDATRFVLIGSLSGSAALSASGQFSLALKTAVVGCFCALVCAGTEVLGQRLKPKGTGVRGPRKRKRSAKGGKEPEKALSKR